MNGGSQHPEKRKRGGHGPTLADEVEHLLPTPVTADSRGTRNRRLDGTPYGQGYGETLTDAAALFPTPRAGDGTKGSPNQLQGSRPSLANTANKIGATPLLPTPRASHHEEGEGAADAWLSRRAKTRKNGKRADTSLPLGLAVQLRPELTPYAIGGSTPPRSRGGRRSQAPQHPGQLTITDVSAPDSSNG